MRPGAGVDWDRPRLGSPWSALDGAGRMRADSFRSGPAFAMVASIQFLRGCRSHESDRVTW